MSKKMMVLTGVLLFLLAGALVFGLLMWKHKNEMVASPVSFMVNAEKWSADSSSPIPVHVTGETTDKEKVDTKYFIGASNKDLMLKPGTYEVEVYASPVNTDGGMYRCSESEKLVVPKNTDKSKAKSGKAKGQPSASSSDALGVSVEVSLTPVPVNEITDEEIDKAQAAMKEAGLSEEKINTFVEAARKARQAELDRIEKERKAKEAAAERARKYGKLAGQYLGLSGVDGEGILYVSSDGTAVYKFWEYRMGPASNQCYASGGAGADCRGLDGKNYFEYPLTFTSAMESGPGYYVVTFAEGFNYAYSNPEGRQDIEAGRLMGINKNDPNGFDAFTPNPAVDF